MTTKTIALILGFGLIAACQPEASSKEATLPEQAPGAVTSASAAPEATAAVRKDYTGQLITFRDGGYPISMLELGPAGAVADAEDNLLIYYNDQDQATGGKGDEIQALVGKAVQVAYNELPDPRIIDVMLDGATLIPEDDAYPKPAPAPTDKTATGVMTGSAEPQGDLPTLITLTTADGTVHTFETFTGGTGLPEADGKTVTIRWQVGTKNEFVSVRAAP
jgi:hypothetical protein